MTKIIPPDSFLNQDLSLIIDVRSPREYAESHIVGAQNFPVLSDEEHQQIVSHGFFQSKGFGC